MSEDEFWMLIGTLNGWADADSVAPLTSTLAQLPEAQIVAFEDHLAAALHELDSPIGADKLIEGESMTLGDDGYLYARAAVVASGREAWQRVVDDPASIPATWQSFDGESLLYVAPEAYQESTGEPWGHVSPVNYETGSNTTNWG